MTKKSQLSQKERILRYLQEGKTLNRLNSWSELGILEAPARISELRSQGFIIETKMISVQNRYGEEVKVAEWSMLRNNNLTDGGEGYILSEN